MVLPWIQEKKKAQKMELLPNRISSWDVAELGQSIRGDMLVQYTTLFIQGDFSFKKMQT